MARYLLTYCFLLGSFAAQAQADGLAYKRILIAKIGMDRSIDAFDERLRAEFQRLDTNEDGGITRDDLATGSSLQMAEARARYMSSWLRNDVDGDFNITTDELRQSVRFRSLSQGGVGALPPPEKVAATIEKKIADALAIDADGDGTITLDELSEAANARAEMIANKDSVQTLPGNELDLNCDDAITEDEFVSVFREVFVLADQNGDGAISRSEHVTGLSRAIMDGFVPSGITEDFDGSDK